MVTETLPSIDVRRYHVRIGERELARTPMVSRNPATGEPVAEVDEATPDDVAAAVDEAERAFERAWAPLPPERREGLMRALADAIEAHSEELALTETLDNGMPLQMARGSVARTAAQLRYCAGWATKLGGDSLEPARGGGLHCYTRREPMGVVGAIVSWNSPLASTGLKVSAALAAGCTVVLKPATETPLSALRLAELAAECGMPAGVITVLPGSGPVVGGALVTNPRVRKIAFTGSTAVGRQLVRDSADHLPHLTLELGGKSPSLVFADVDLDKVVPKVGWAIFRNSGQICVAGSRVFVDRRIFGAFTERLAEFARSLNVGDGRQPSTDLGPLITEAHTKVVLGYLQAGIAAGADLRTGGRQLSDERRRSGQFVEPAVFARVHDQMQIMREEIFGPVVGVAPFDGIADALARAGATEYGLAAGIWTNDMATAHHVAARLRTGTVWINGHAVYDPALPFGGRLASGFGAKSGREAVLECTELKTVVATLDVDDCGPPPAVS
jgi:aldehyde dehydrogenase (NAD+)